MKRDKSKNIVCACTYRHPGTDSLEFTEYLDKKYPNKSAKKTKNVMFLVTLTLIC